MLNLENFSLKETLKLNESIINFKICPNFYLRFVIDNKYIVYSNSKRVKFGSRAKELNFFELDYKFKGIYTPESTIGVFDIFILNDNFCLRHFINTFDIDFSKIDFSFLLEEKERSENFVKEMYSKIQKIENSLKNMNLEFL